MHKKWYYPHFVLWFDPVKDFFDSLTLTFYVCSDSEAAEGAAGGARSGPQEDAGWARADPEGAAGARQEAAAGVWPPGGAGERQSPPDGGGESSAAAAGTQRIPMCEWVSLH